MAILIAIALANMNLQLPDQFVEKIPNSLVSFKMVKAPAGKIAIRGKDIEIKPFFIADTELTWDAYDIYAFRLDLTAEQQATGFDAESRPSKPYGAPDRGFGHSGYPALGMTANAATKFCEWLSAKTGKKYRLPTEAEWEYAARAGASTEPNLSETAWNWDNAEDQTQPVGKLKPNAWGLYDMLGNTKEWTTGIDGVPVCCGGSYDQKANLFKFGLRELYDPKWQTADAHVPKSKWWLSDGPMIGMRVVCEATDSVSL